MTEYHDRLYREMLQMAVSPVYTAAGGLVGSGQALGVAVPPYYQNPNPVPYMPWGVPQTHYKFDPDNMRAALAIRMGWNTNQTGQKYFEHCEPRKLNEEKAVVFVITDGRAMCIEDDLNLFPSDTLVTQLRLLQEAK